MTFKKGQSGNPSGRPKGLVNPLRKALELKSEELFNKAMDMALKGDQVMLKMFMDRFKFDIRDALNINLQGSSKEMLDDAINEFKEGNIDNTELNSLVGAVNTRIHAIEAKSLEERIGKLEETRNDHTE